eukprot:TRINITY_DN80714_c0_g1_i1.p2 TRINITY_DN80714_c0_g1~~TRINITY_DN80714_c0_g1_i1.p2  ORF type:complete len:195 (-),score=48.20 TRINITY_DN80714_c0_g1_i1:152-736(-)
MASKYAVPMLVAVALLASQVSFASAALTHTLELGPAINFTLQWGNGDAAGDLDICFSAVGLDNTKFLALGFSAKPQTMMANTDIVVAWFSANGPIIEAKYAVNATGYPGGKAGFALSNTHVLLDHGFLRACFTRAANTGNVPLVDGGSVRWATGAVTNNDLTYHGFDVPDPTGKTQVHRSQDTPTVNWLTGNRN